MALGSCHSVEFQMTNFHKWQGFNLVSQAGLENGFEDYDVSTVLGLGVVRKSVIVSARYC